MKVAFEPGLQTGEGEALLLMIEILLDLMQTLYIGILVV